MEFNIEGLLKAHGKKRIFRAKRKFTQAGVISHITQRAAGCEPLFLEDEDYLTMLGLLKEVSKKFDLTFHALCLMPNHVHLLLETGQENSVGPCIRYFFPYGIASTAIRPPRTYFRSAYRRGLSRHQLFLSVRLPPSTIRSARAWSPGRRLSLVLLRLFCSASAPLPFPARVYLSLLDRIGDAPCGSTAGSEKVGRSSRMVLEEETAVEKLVSDWPGFSHACSATVAPGAEGDCRQKAVFSTRPFWRRRSLRRGFGCPAQRQQSGPAAIW